MTKQQTQHIRLGSIRYIHDPDAAQEWFNLYVQIAKEKMLQQYSNSCPNLHRIEQEGEQREGEYEKSCSILPLFD